MSIEAAKVRLKEGNQRFINGSVTGFFANIALSLDAGRQTQNIDCALKNFVVAKIYVILTLY